MRLLDIFRFVLFIEFQSTHPMRDATSTISYFKGKNCISIHASHAGCDDIVLVNPLAVCYFNPRIPCGMRLRLLVHENTVVISIHASHAGCDVIALMRLFSVSADFNPRIPCGMRLNLVGFFVVLVCYFNPRIPCGMRLTATPRQC